jgi:hypothetical protein
MTGFEFLIGPALFMALSCHAFVLPCPTRPSAIDVSRRHHHHQLSMSLSDATGSPDYSVFRRSCLSVGLASITGLMLEPSQSRAEDASIFSPAFVQEYEDFIKTKEGWSYRDVKEGKGDTKVQQGDRVVYDWSGYTIGYFGRPFQAKGGPQGGAFDKELDYERTVIGSHAVVRGLEEAFINMKPGGVRQVVVPYGALSYPPTKDGDGAHAVVGPKPTTFSGLRALNFVLDNPRLDRTLLFNVKVIRIDKPNGKGGFVRG